MKNTSNKKVAKGKSPFNSLEEVASTKQVLHRDLKKWITQQNSGMKFLQHPLVYRVPFFDASPFEINFTNGLYHQKKLQIKQAIKDKDAQRYVFTHERLYRLNALLDLELKGILSVHDNKFWQIVGFVWKDSENINQMLEHWKELFEQGRYLNKLKLMMNTDELKKFKSLHNQITVYRGGSHDGLSYTLSREKAIWFAKRWSNDTPKLYTRVISKKHAVAYFEREDEILIEPELLNTGEVNEWIIKE